MVSYLTPSGSPASLAQLDYSDQTWDRPWHLARGQITTAERMPSALLARTREPAPWARQERPDLLSATTADPLTGRETTLADLLRDRLNNDGLLVVHHGKIVAETYTNGLREDDLHVVHSCSKTLTTMMVGIAISEGRVDPTAQVSDLISELAESPSWEGVTVQHVLDMASGHDTEEHYENADSMYWRYADAVGYYGAADEGAGVLEFVRTELTRRAAPPSTVFNYASYLTNLLPIMLERAYGVSAPQLFEERIYRHLGAERDALVNLDRFGRSIVEGQVNLTLRDFGRWAWLLVNEGRNLDGEQVLPTAWVEEAFRADPARRHAFAASEYAEMLPGAEYHNQGWLIDPGRPVLAMLGIHGQFAFLDPQRRLMMAGLSSFPEQANALLMATMQTAWASVNQTLFPPSA
jgi:CubicO group peptidase (beta-lactamase class C family)